MVTVEWQHSWSLIKEKLKKEFPQLTDMDVTYIQEEDEESFLTNIEHKLGINRNELLSLFSKYRVEQKSNYL